MKKRTSRKIAGALAVCMMVGAPANLWTVEAASTVPKENDAMLAKQYPLAKLQARRDDYEWEIGIPVEPEDGSESEAGNESENRSESEAGNEREIRWESERETESDGFEESSACSETERCGYMELPVEHFEVVDGKEMVLDADQTAASQDWGKLCGRSVKLTFTNNGEFDYRTYFGNSQKPEMHIEIASNVVHERNSSNEESVADFSTQNQERIFDDVTYKIQIEDENVVSVDDASAGIESSQNGEGNRIYTTKNQDVALVINGVGETEITVSVQDSTYDVRDETCKVSVKDSPLQDADFYMEFNQQHGKVTATGSPDWSETGCYSYEEWIQYLEEHDHWVNGGFLPQLSEEGQKYYSQMNMSHGTDAAQLSEIGSDCDRQTYVVWAEHPDRNASTEHVENGARTFEAGIDTEAPDIKELTTDSVCYEPTRTETEQYYAEDFILKGSLTDAGSGISRVEYTTNFNAGEEAVWSDVSVSDGAFRITLSDGCYEAIAVRAYDNAGNVSMPKRFVNDKDEYIKVIVDRSEPVLNVTARSGNTDYDGKNDRWTNQDVVYQISFDKSSCPYAGIYQYEYAYEKIGSAVNHEDMTQMSEKWIGIEDDGESSAELKIADDKNGYYYFRAVSKSGVSAKSPAKQRILTQHQAAEIKPIAVSRIDDAKRRDDWYNKASGVPSIRFEYPDYDNGVTSMEYDAPVTIHYSLTAMTEDGGIEQVITDNEENNAVMGVMSSERVKINADGKKEFELTRDDLDDHVITFGYDKATGYAKDGIYTLEYWVTDKAGNASEKQMEVYKIDCHEPTALRVEVADTEMPADSGDTIVYERFYKEAVAGKAFAEYGISGKESLKILKAKKLGEWKETDINALEDGERFDILPNIRCFLYVRAEDQAGNVTEGWTRGVVVDNMLPNEAAGSELIVAPEGANSHGFFNQDVKVRIRVKDSPENDNCAALMSVNGSVGRDGTDTITDKELFSFTKELPSDDELTGAAAFETVQLVDAKANESNEAYIEVTATDRSGNARTSQQLLKIDVTKPVINISFDEENAVNGSFYNKSRTATVHVQELNFDPAAVEVAITRDGQPVEMTLSDWTSDGSEHYASVVFEEDGDYTMEVHCTDLADNESETVQADRFTIDCTAPEVSLELIPSGEHQTYSEGYYSSDVTAQITVTEHNFQANDFVMDGIPAAAQLTWEHEGDVHTASVRYQGDQAYAIRCYYTDLAGNAASVGELLKEFVIDTTAPMLAISGVADGSANSGEVTPVVTVLDLNIAVDAVALSVVTGRGKKIENTIVTETIDDGSGIGYRLTLSDMTDQADDIYYLTVSACDKAGNEDSLTYRFSLNRKGSAFDLSDLTRLMQNQYHTYMGLEDICITEMNIDKVSEFEVYISRNGELGYAAEYEKEVQGSDSIGYTYTYRIRRENFAEEGSYRLSMYSKDRAGNEVNNSLDVNGNEIEFIIDNTAPKVVIDGVETGKVYDVEAQRVGIVITDNFKLEEAEITLVNKRNEVLDSWNYMELSREGDTLYITIPEYNEEVSLLYRTRDAAGNEVQTFRGESTALADFLVTTDKLVQFVNKPTQTPLGRMILLLIAIAVIAAIYFKRLRSRRKFNR